MEIEDFDFELPEKLIAQTPLKERANSKLMVVDRAYRNISHYHFYNIIDFLQPGDCIVLNDTKVLPARLYGVKEETGANIEVLLLNQAEDDHWEVLLKPAKKVKVGTKIIFGNNKLIATCVEKKDHGGSILQFAYKGIFYQVLDELGEMPLPPYIKEQLHEKDRYQTVYAKEQGSAAAPTAGLHFTAELLDNIRKKGVQIAYITLHVGLGTFRPVNVDTMEEHEMHAEFYQMTAETAKQLNKVKQAGGRVVSVGTTSTRTLETIANKTGGIFEAQNGWTDIFIYPPYQFKAVDGLITNFHLPKSTLIMLVSAFSDRELILDAYQHAIKEKYRFFSFGDAMLIK